MLLIVAIGGLWLGGLLGFAFTAMFTSHALADMEAELRQLKDEMGIMTSVVPERSEERVIPAPGSVPGLAS